MGWLEQGSCQSSSESPGRQQIPLFPPAPPRTKRIFAGRVRSSSAARTFWRPDLAKSQIVPVSHQPQVRHGQARTSYSTGWAQHSWPTGKVDVRWSKSVKWERCGRQRELPSKHCGRMQAQHYPHANVSSQITAHTCSLRSLHKEHSQQTVSTCFNPSCFRVSTCLSCFNKSISLQNPQSIKARTRSVLEPAHSCNKSICVINT